MDQCQHCGRSLYDAAHRISPPNPSFHGYVAPPEVRAAAAAAERRHYAASSPWVVRAAARQLPVKEYR